MQLLTKKRSALLFIALLAAQTGHSAEDVMIVYDASGSMWGQVDGAHKITTAREVLADLVQGWPDDANLGLMAYGHRRSGDCQDIETLIKPRQVDRKAFIQTVNAINPKGKTPIAASLQQAADVLQYRDNNATVVLISDGLESCHGDPCAVAAELKEKGISFTAHVVGFDLDEQGNQALSCIAKNTGGIFVPASNASELKDALRQVQATVTSQEVSLEPEPESQPELPDVEIEITAPEQVTAGTFFTTQWSQSLDIMDRISILPAGSETDQLEPNQLNKNSARVGTKTEGRLTAPTEPGSYEIHYIRNADKKSFGSTNIEVMEPEEITIQAPEQVIAGTIFTVQWSQTPHSNDWISLLTAGADADQPSIRSVKILGAETVRFTAPSEPGLYEIRYIRNADNKALGSTSIEVLEPEEITILAPEQVIAGTVFTVHWSQSLHVLDRIGILPAGAEQGQSATSSVKVSRKDTDRLTAPLEPGTYEIRYMRDTDGKILSSTNIEVMEPEKITIQAPKQVIVGSTFAVQWSQSLNSSDWISILPAGADADLPNTSSFKILSKKETYRLTAPDKPGLYEIRYIRDTDKKTLGSTGIEVVSKDTILETDVTFKKVPASAKSGEQIEPPRVYRRPFRFSQPVSCCAACCL